MEKASLERWVDLCSRLEVGKEPEMWYGELEKAYSSPVRAYHNLEHVAFCLEQFELLRSLATHAKAVELAIWFHDSIYDTRSNENEEKSDEFAQQVIEDMGLEDSLCKLVSGLILVTKHDIEPKNTNEKIILDVDLAILGQGSEEFDAYEVAVREEYAWVAEQTYRSKRAEVLRGFLERKSIFSTPVFIRKYEEAARENLANSIRRLKEIAY